MDYQRIIHKTKLAEDETKHWLKVTHRMYFPHSEKFGVFVQQDGFLDKEIIPVTSLSKEERPINQKWSWDRILRSCYIKQADVLQGMYFFENHFSETKIEKHFDFYEPLTVHESSLSPCIHSILASKINKPEKAYEMYLRTARLDLDDYNHEVAEGCHITSMAGTWLSIVQGFGGMRNFDSVLSFNPTIPKEWTSYSFKINYRGNTLEVYVNHHKTEFNNLSDEPISIVVDGEKKVILPKSLFAV
jgi:maltose phosphorylase